MGLFAENDLSCDEPYACSPPCKRMLGNGSLVDFSKVMFLWPFESWAISIWEETSVEKIEEEEEEEEEELDWDKLSYL